MIKIQIHNNELTGRYLDSAVDSLKEGGLLVIPTDTIYAVVCDALNPKAIARLCALKGINPEKTNLSILCCDIAMASEYAKFDNYAFRLLKENTPGPFTFLFRAASSLPKAFKNRKIVGIRIPDNKADLSLINALSNPLLSTSISFDDEDYGRNPELIAENYEDKADLMILGDDGSLTPSAIIDCTGSTPEIVREGPEPVAGM